LDASPTIAALAGPASRSPAAARSIASAQLASRRLPPSRIWGAVIRCSEASISNE
jgi:hypothetical protein